MLVPLLLVGLVPILTGAIDTANVTGLVPPTAAYSGVDGTWSIGGWTLFLGGLYIAAWSTYGFETAVCYTRELKNPKTDTFKAIFYSGLLCCLFFFLVPFAFQGVLGHAACWHPALSMAPALPKRLATWWAAQGDHADLRDPDDPRPVPGHHDGHGRFVAHPLSGLEGWLAAALPDAR